MGADTWRGVKLFVWTRPETVLDRLRNTESGAKGSFGSGGGYRSTMFKDRTVSTASADGTGFRLIFLGGGGRTVAMVGCGGREASQISRSR